jgi:hypothetical protein
MGEWGASLDADGGKRKEKHEVVAPRVGEIA